MIAVKIRSFSPPTLHTIEYLHTVECLHHFSSILCNVEKSPKIILDHSVIYKIHFWIFFFLFFLFSEGMFSLFYEWSLKRP